jgi:ubiquinone/menaquinone biosynthesis C-methylase UbiE
MIREAKGIATLEGLADAMDFEAGSAEAFAFPDNSFDAVFSVTVMEEVNTDKMLSEMIRVTKPGGRVGVLGDLSTCHTVSIYLCQRR